MAKKKAEQPLTLEEEAKVMLVPVGHIRPSPFQNRTRGLSDDDPALLELAGSIGSLGLLQPITLRLHNDMVPDIWEIVYGERRWRACRLAQLKVVRAFIVDMDDATAAMAVVTENRQREELTPLEEARGYQNLIEAGHPLEFIASKLNCTPAYVRRMAQLTQLSEEWLKLASEPYDPESCGDYGPRINSWTPAHLQQVAVLPLPTQAKLLGLIKNKGRRPDIADLRRLVAELTRQLGEAPFDIHRVDIQAGVHLPSCQACPKRQGADTTLFGIEAAVRLEDDICLDAACYQRKVDREIREKIKDAKAKVPDAIEVKGQKDYSGNITFTHKGATFERASKGTPGAVAAVVTSKSGAGKVVHVRQVKAADEREKPLTVGALRQLLMRQRMLNVCRAVRFCFSQHPLPPTWHLADLVRFYVGMGGAGLTDAKQGNAHSPKVREWFMDWTAPRLAEPDLIARLWPLVRVGICETMPHDHKEISWWHNQHWDLEYAELLVDQMGWSWERFVNEQADALPFPAEWSGLGDDQVPGQPSAAKKKARKK